MATKLPRILREIPTPAATSGEELRAVLKAADFGPNTACTTIAMTSAPLVVIEYQPNVQSGALEFAKAYAFNTNKEEPFTVVSDHVLALNVPIRLPLTYSSRALIGTVDQRAVYIVGQVNLPRADLTFVQQRLRKLRTSSAVARYYLNSVFKQDWKLSKLLRFCAIDVMFDLGGRLTRAIPATTLEAHLFTIGFRPYNSHLGFQMQSALARELCNSSEIVAGHLDNHKRRNSEYVITKLAVVPAIPTQAIANVITFEPNKE